MFLVILQLVESQKLHESKLQATIDQLSAQYYYVFCDIEAYNIRKGIVALEKKIQASQRDKQLFIRDNFTPSPHIARRLSVP